MLNWDYYHRRKRLNVDSWLAGNGITSYGEFCKFLLGIGVQPPPADQAPTSLVKKGKKVERPKKYDPLLDLGLQQERSSDLSPPPPPPTKKPTPKKTSSPKSPTKKTLSKPYLKDSKKTSGRSTKKATTSGRHTKKTS